jgi:2-iminoacetate synthase ThiH
VSLPASDSPLSGGDAGRLAATAVEEGRLERAAAERLAANLDSREVLEAVLEAATESKRAAHGDLVSVSRNVFIPLTNLCRNRCSYCTFAKLPDSPEARTYTLEEVEEVVRGGVATGCIEALFCLGDKPEVAYRSYRDELALRGYASTTDLLVEGCRVAFEAGACRTCTRPTRSPPFASACTKRRASSGSRSPRACCSVSARTTSSASIRCSRFANSTIASVTSRR